ncbi:hypothetical protein LCGC14_2753630, partial [marine sediment metagenome]
MADIINDYRPEAFKEVYGQEHIVKSIVRLLKKRPPHSYLFHGPSGVGKTTVARILARELGCSASNLIEIDAATFSGVSEARKISDRQTYKALDGQAQVTIVDECHALSQAAWKALLKPIEEAPDSFYWIFCTTEPTKIPKTVKTRCHEYAFQEVGRNDLLDLLEEVAEEEEIELDKRSMDIIVQAAQGSPRQALVYLSICRGAKNSKEVQAMLRDGYEHMEVVNLCRYLLFERGSTFGGAIKIIQKFKDEIQAETARLIILNYCS